jgi:hypothetical protein
VGCGGEVASRVRTAYGPIGRDRDSGRDRGRQTVRKEFRYSRLGDIKDKQKIS